MGNGNNGSKGGNLLSRVAYSFGNVGQSAFYNALSTYFIVYVTSSLFSGVDKSVATKLIGIITGLVVVIRIAEIFIDPLQAVAAHRWYRFRHPAGARLHWSVRSGEREYYPVHRAVHHHLHCARRVLLAA